MFNAVIRIIILLAPFFILSVFVSKTQSCNSTLKRTIAIRATLAILFIGVITYFLGNLLLRGLGITLDAFSVGAGLVLLLSGLEMVRDSVAIRQESTSDFNVEIAIVPLAIPCAMGPGTLGALLVMGNLASGNWRAQITDLLGMTIAVFLVGIMLFYGEIIERMIKPSGISVLSKLTGLFLTALAAQIILGGIKNLLQ